MKKVKAKTAHVFQILFLLVLLTATYCYAMFQGGFVSWFLFGSLCPLVIYSLILSFYPLGSINVERELKQLEYLAGEKVEINVRITRNNFFPLFYLIIEDGASDKLKERSGQSFKMILLPLMKKEIQYRYVIENIPRGEYIFSHFVLKTGDLFGFIKKEKEEKQETKILVYPSYIPLIYEPFESHYEQGMTAIKDLVQRDTTMAVSVREYHPGDKFSWIHWKAFAKRNDIMTKEFEQRHNHDMLIVLDRSPNPSFEPAVLFAASTIRAILNKGAEVGLYSFGETRDYYPVSRGEFQLRRLNYYLAKVEDNASIPFHKVIEQEQLFYNPTTSCLFIVNQIDQAALENLCMINQKKGNVLLFIIKGKNEKATSWDLESIDYARRRGIVGKILNEGEFTGAFRRGEWAI